MASSSQFASLSPSPFTWLLRQIENPKAVKINVRSEGVAIFLPPTTLAIRPFRCQLKCIQKSCGLSVRYIYYMNSIYLY